MYVDLVRCDRGTIGAQQGTPWSVMPRVALSLCEGKDLAPTHSSKWALSKSSSTAANQRDRRSKL